MFEVKRFNQNARGNPLPKIANQNVNYQQVRLNIPGTAYVKWKNIKTFNYEMFA